MNTWCPVMQEEPADPAITTTYDGQTVGLCCKRCLRKFTVDPSAYAANLEVSLEMQESSPVFLDDGASNPERSVRGEASASPSKSEEAHGGTAHDHAHHSQDDGASLDGSWITHASDFLGKLHVLAVHLPIALLLFAALFELVGWRGAKPVWLHAARINFAFGALTALSAAGLGWLAAAGVNYPADLAEIMTYHRWLGVSVATLSFAGLISLAAGSGRNWGKLVYRLILFTMVIAVPVTAHFGGSLVYGADYLF